jgi:hypothetical protein
MKIHNCANCDQREGEEWQVHLALSIGTELCSNMISIMTPYTTIQAA